LAVEIDGDSHSLGDRPEQDARRDAWLSREGIGVLRFGAADVMKDVESVVRSIIEAARN
jgi:very-short-patch-repair endonuclease